jgi:two-component sensor histidine kinase
VTNSAKYGSGTIDLHCHIDKPPLEGALTAVLAISDRGPGFPENFAFDKMGGLGSRLIDNLVRSSGGTIEIRNRKTGSRVIVRFPIGPA